MVAEVLPEVSPSPSPQRRDRARLRGASDGLRRCPEVASSHALPSPPKEQQTSIRAVLGVFLLLYGNRPLAILACMACLKLRQSGGRNIGLDQSLITLCRGLHRVQR